MRISDWSSGVCSSDLLARGDAVYQVLRQTTNGHDTALADQVAASPMENHWTQRAQAAIVRAGRGPTERGESAPGARTQVHMPVPARSEEHTSELQSLMRISYAVFCLKKKTHYDADPTSNTQTSRYTCRIRAARGYRA